MRYAMRRELVDRAGVLRGEIKLANRGDESAPVPRRQRPGLTENGVDTRAMRPHDVVATHAHVLDERADGTHARARARDGFIRRVSDARSQ